jgi:hypothetical protein
MSAKQYCQPMYIIVACALTIADAIRRPVVAAGLRLHVSDVDSSFSCGDPSMVAWVGSIPHPYFFNIDVSLQ